MIEYIKSDFWNFFVLYKSAEKIIKLRKNLNQSYCLNDMATHLIENKY